MGKAGPDLMEPETSRWSNFLPSATGDDDDFDDFDDNNEYDYHKNNDVGDDDDDEDGNDDGHDDDIDDDNDDDDSGSGGDDDDDDDNLHSASWECRWSLRLTNDQWSEQKDSPNTDPEHLFPQTENSFYC